ncbi:MAG: hypothetical protein H6664_09285 [Ardenticatenaceae bacterium]|nr:hypothetical protein [Ardenticatenaceae bacterium]MCB9004548.1 hypothetical protein [Ardenticatenaceae bacterium]
MTALTTTNNTTSSLKAGIAAGLIGGLVFGMMMGMMGALPMVGMLIHVDSAIVGFIVHMGISATIGAIYGIVAARLPQKTSVTALAGIVNGIIWWVLGALIMMPLMLGMSDMVFAIGQTQWFSLMGHIIFGVITAFAFIPLSKRL